MAAASDDSGPYDPNALADVSLAASIVYASSAVAWGALCLSRAPLLEWSPRLLLSLTALRGPWLRLAPALALSGALLLLCAAALRVLLPQDSVRPEAWRARLHLWYVARFVLGCQPLVAATSWVHGPYAGVLWSAALELVSVGVPIYVGVRLASWRSRHDLRVPVDGASLPWLACLATLHPGCS